MATSTLVQARVDRRVKDDANKVFRRLGLDMPTAIRLFLNATKESNNLPFAIGKTPNRATAHTMREARAGKGLSKPYTDLDEMFSDIMGEKYARH
ncbi:type II toxin-antitoxin system RelB/DinJ family antitoxin [Candidatus Saccharibacteria bacterium]|nr:type II toxin-antitoxin system RelB/DinJ family antitoxin [Candidatus Saccharibacteria bacterium]